RCVTCHLRSDRADSCEHTMMPAAPARNDSMKRPHSDITDGVEGRRIHDGSRWGRIVNGRFVADSDDDDDEDEDCDCDDDDEDCDCEDDDNEDRADSFTPDGGMMTQRARAKRDRAMLTEKATGAAQPTGASIAPDLSVDDTDENAAKARLRASWNG